MLLQVNDATADCLNCVLGLEGADLKSITIGCVITCAAWVVRRIELNRIKKGKKPLFKK